MSRQPSSSHTKRNAILLVVFIIGLYGLLPQVHDFHSSLHAMTQARWLPLGWALVAVFATYGLAAGTYMALALRPLRFGRTLIVEMAGLLVNRLVPAGIGGLSLNYAYLRTNRHTAHQAITVVGLNNLLGLIGHSLLLLALFSVRPDALSRFQLPRLQYWWLLVAGVVLATALLIVGRHDSWRKRWQQFGLSLRTIAGFYGRHPLKIGAGLGCSILLTSCNALCFWACCQSMGLGLSLIASFLVFSVSVIVGTATPTPGGLGGVEAGLLAGLLAAHIAAAPALAAVLLYRLVSFWFALLLGGAALLVVRSRHYVRWQF